MIPLALFWTFVSRAVLSGLHAVAALRPQYAQGCTRSTTALVFNIPETRLDFFIPVVEQWLFDRYVCVLLTYLLTGTSTQ